MTENETATPRQRGISNDVLAERLQNYFDRSVEASESLHRHMESIDAKVETALTEIRLHQTLPYHPQTQQDVTRISNTLLQMERKFGDIDKQFGDIKTEKSYAQGLTDGIRQSSSAFERLGIFIVASALPTGILVYVTFFT